VLCMDSGRHEGRNDGTPRRVRVLYHERDGLVRGDVSWPWLLCIFGLVVVKLHARIVDVVVIVVGCRRSLSLDSQTGTSALTRSPTRPACICALPIKAEPPPKKRSSKNHLLSDS